MVVVAHRVCFELYEHNDSRGAVSVGRRCKEHINKRVNESPRVWLESFIEHRCEWSKVLLQRFEFAQLEALAAERPKFTLCRNGTSLDRLSQSLPGHRVFRRDHQVSLGLSRIA